MSRSVFRPAIVRLVSRPSFFRLLFSNFVFPRRYGIMHAMQCRGKAPSQNRRVFASLEKNGSIDTREISRPTRISASIVPPPSVEWRGGRYPRNISPSDYSINPSDSIGKPQRGTTILISPSTVVDEIDELMRSFTASLPSF